MILAIDVFYKEDCTARVSGILFDNFSDEKGKEDFLIDVNEVKAYKSGEFYKRELPCILSLLKELKSLPEYIIVDGYVYLNDKLGLGGHLYEVLNKEVKIIGVAKSPFYNISIDTKLYRGDSKKPLFIKQDEAKELIENMHGKFRIPTLLTKVDRIGRD